MNYTAEPYVPVVPPRNPPPIIQLNRAGVVDAYAEELGADDAAAMQAAAQAALRAQTRRDFLLWGGVGVAAGAVVSAGITAMAFGRYRKTGSIVGPAMVSGLGSLVVGGALLWGLSRTFVGPVDNRFVAMAAGAKLAAF